MKITSKNKNEIQIEINPVTNHIAEDLKINESHYCVSKRHINYKLIDFIMTISKNKPPQTLFLKLAKLISVFLILLYPQFSVVAQSNETTEQLIEVKSATPNFFVSPNGNDNNSGTSPTAAWRTLQKVNSTSFNAGAVIAFERGGSWYGQLIIPSSNITITAYGTGNKPIIHGWMTLSGWTNDGAGNFSVTNQNLLSRVRILKIGDRIYNKGRFPKNEWLRTHASSGGLASGNVTSNNLTGTPNFNGGQIVLNKNSWVIDVGNITSHSGGTIGYSGTSSHYNAQVHYGFFIQNHINTLTQFGDWMFNGTTRRLTMHFGSQNPANYVVRVSSIDDVVVINGRSNITIENLSIQGSNRTAVRLIGSGARNITIRGCDFLKNGNDGIFMDGTGGHPDGMIVENSLFEDTKNRAIETHESRNVTIRFNVFRRTFLDPAGGHNGDFSGATISLGANGWRNGNFTVTGNRIYDSGYNAIRFSGSNVVVERNFIHRYNLTKIDGGAIYTYGRGQSSVTGDVHVNRVISHNIISNPNYTIPILTQWGNEQGFGIYFDDRTRNVICEYNTLIDNSTGIYIHNSRELVVRHNLIYRSRDEGVTFGDDGIAGPPDGDVVNIDFQRNIIYSLGSSRVLVIHNQFSPNINLGTLNNNYYIKPTGTIYVEKHQNWTNYERMSLQQWRDKYGYDLNTRRTPTTSTVSEVFVNSNVNSNLTVDVGRNRIDIYGNAITNSVITLRPFESILVLGGQSAPTQPNPNPGLWMLTTTTTGQGSITRNPDKSQYTNNESVQLTATPIAGSSFVNWTENGNIVSTNTTFTVVMDRNRNLIANFTLLRHTVTLASNIPNAGVLQGSGTFDHGQSATIRAIPNTNFRFTHWHENGAIVSNQPELALVVNTNRSLQAVFAESNQIVTITATGNPSGFAFISGAGDYRVTQQVQLTATPADDNYHFVSWTENGRVVSTQNPFIFTAQENRLLTANFIYRPEIFSVNALLSIDGAGQITGTGMFESGQTANLAVATHANVVFVGWENTAGQIISRQNPMSIVVNRDIMLTAIVAVTTTVNPQEEFILTVSPNPSNGVFYSNIEGEADIEIYNLNGSMLQKRHLPNGRDPIDLTELPAGVYLLVFYAMESVFTKKVVIN